MLGGVVQGSVPAGTLLAANNLSDLNNESTARTNLGLGSAATQSASAFDAAGAAAAAAAASLPLAGGTLAGDLSLATHTLHLGGTGLLNSDGSGNVVLGTQGTLTLTGAHGISVASLMTMGGSIAMAGNNISGGATFTATTFVGALTGTASGNLPIAGGLWFDYLILQNAGTYTLYDHNMAVVASNSTPDIVPLLQTAINNLVTGGIGGTILVGPGQFLAQPTWSVDPNATSHSYVIGIPLVLKTNANCLMPITIRGAGAGAVAAVYTGGTSVTNVALPTVGTQIYFNEASTSLPNSQNDFFYALCPPNTQYANYVELHTGAIRFTQPLNTWNVSTPLNMVSMGNIAQLTWSDGLVIDTYTPNGGNMSQPTSYGIGLIMPGAENECLCHGDWCNITGYGIGIQASDHTDIDTLYLQSCYEGLQLATQEHGATIGHLLFQQCAIQIVLTGSSGYGFNNLNVAMLDIEAATSLTGGNAWQNYSSMFLNGFNNFAGSIVFNANEFNSTVWADLSASQHIPAGNFNFEFNGGGTLIAGTTAGYAWAQLVSVVSQAKTYLVYLSGYNNTSGTSQTYTFPIPFSSAPTILQDATGAATASATTLTLPHGMSGPVTGVIRIEEPGGTGALAVAGGTMNGTLAMASHTLSLDGSASMKSDGSGNVTLTGTSFLFSGPVVLNNPQITLTDAASIATDASKSNIFTVTLGGNRTLANPTNPTDGQRVIWKIRQPGSGGPYSLGYGTQFKWGTATAPTLSTAANAVDLVGGVYDATKNEWMMGFTLGF